VLCRLWSDSAITLKESSGLAAPPGTLKSQNTANLLARFSVPLRRGGLGLAPYSFTFPVIQSNGYRSLDEGSEEFEVKQGPKGLRAENVNRV
jgi:hypothetical protein